MQNLPLYVPKIKLKKIGNKPANEKFDLDTYHEAREHIAMYFDEFQWWSIADGSFFYDKITELVWFNIKDSEEYDCETKKIESLLESTPFSKIFAWKIPDTREAVGGLVSNSPLRLPNNKRVGNIDMLWHGEFDHSKKVSGMGATVAGTAVGAAFGGPFGAVAGGVIGKTIFGSKVEKRTLIPVSNQTKGCSPNQIIELCLNEKLSIHPANLLSDSIELKDFIKQFDIVKNYYQSQEDKVRIVEWQNLDYISTRLPTIDNLRFTDINQGIWEFYVPKIAQDEFTQVDNPDNIRPRNPELDIRSAKVGIDFGTSSTVVAIRDSGKDELLRIGLQEIDFDKNKINENDFENPTILEFLDIISLKESWHSESYRPLVNWSDIHCSHEAQNRLRQNDTDTVIVGSMLLRLKQWALRDEQQLKVRVTDSKNKNEFELDYLKELNPIKGQPIILSEDYPDIDPIELYAWFLGMNINWRDRGIYLTYYLTFPVAYPSETKRKILASFRRGLQRSLPHSLTYSDRFNDFSVTELASEPAAFAAAALPTLKIEPTEEGLAYAVFDFGGGTTDFDYGIYRTPNDDECDDGWDEVIEHFGSSGDKFLGGENLIENIAYITFVANQNTCRDKQITFTKPIDADSFAGSERLISNSQSALTNTTMLMSKLRPYWEDNENQQGKEPILKLRLLNRNNELIDCELTIDKIMIDQFLHNRLHKGLINFFAGMNASYEKQLGYLPREIHILLAGNSSRSSLLQDIIKPLELDSLESIMNFDENEELLSNNSKEDASDNISEIMLMTLKTYVSALGLKHWNDLPVFIFHKPLTKDINNPYKPNTKTGVALGLLRISPGETLKIINHDLKDDSDSLFPYYVGTHRRNTFEVGIKRGDDSLSWHELGRVRQGIFPLLYSTQPQALNGIQRGTNGLHEKEIEFPGDISKGMRIFGKIVDSNSIELCLAENKESINENTFKKTVEISN